MTPSESQLIGRVPDSQNIGVTLAYSIPKLMFCNMKQSISSRSTCRKYNDTSLMTTWYSQKIFMVAAEELHHFIRGGFNYRIYSFTLLSFKGVLLKTLVGEGVGESAFQAPPLSYATGLRLTNGTLLFIV